MENELIEDRDIIAEKLDEMADIAEYWKRIRQNGRTPDAIRLALLYLAQEIAARVHSQNDNTAAMMDRLCFPNMYHPRMNVKKKGDVA